MIVHFLVDGLARGATYGLIALGFSITYRSTKVFSVAHAAAAAYGALATYAGLAILAQPLSVVLTIAALVGALLGGVLYVTVHQPLYKRHASELIHMMSSLGATIVLINIMTLFVGNAPRLARVEAAPILSIGGTLLRPVQVLQLIVTAGAVVFYNALMTRTHFGLSCRAIADDAQLGECNGVPVGRTRAAAFIFGYLYAAVGGALISLDIGADPHGGMLLMLTAAVSCLVVGPSNPVAPLFIAMLIGALQHLVVWRIPGQWEEVVTFGLLLVALSARRVTLLFSTQAESPR